MTIETMTEDEKVLHGMGYAQELHRRMGTFQNFAISFSIICILSGGFGSCPMFSRRFLENRLKAKLKALPSGNRAHGQYAKLAGSFVSKSLRANPIRHLTR